MSKHQFIALLFLFSGSAFAQFNLPGRLGSKIANKVIDKAADRAAEKVADKVVDHLDKEAGKLADSISKDSKPSGGGFDRLGKVIGGITAAPPPNGNYSFGASYEMKMTLSGKKTETTTYKYRFGEGGAYMGTQVVNSTDPNMKKMYSMSIFDFEKNSIYTFMDENKTMMGLSANFVNTIANAATPAKYTKTGQTKTIYGISCTGWLIEQNGAKTTMWISQSPVPIIAKYYEPFSKMQNSAFGIWNTLNTELNAEMKAGKAMLGVDTQQANGDKMSMEVVNIGANDSLNFSTAGYSNMMGK